MFDKGKGIATYTLALLRESSPQKCSGMARILCGSHSYLRIPTHVQSAIGMSLGLCLPSYSGYSFTDPGVMEG